MAKSVQNLGKESYVPRVAFGNACFYFIFLNKLQNYGLWELGQGVSVKNVTVRLDQAPCRDTGRDKHEMEQMKMMNGTTSALN